MKEFTFSEVLTIGFETIIVVLLVGYLVYFIVNYLSKRKSKNKKSMNKKETINHLIIGAIILGVIILCMWLWPQYKVWKKEMDGKAEYSEAQQNRKIKVEEAKANLDAEKLNAQAEIERAKGAAEAIKIEKGSITPTYIQYLWVRQQGAIGNKTIIYIPTEASLPLLEAGKLNKE